MDKQETTPEQLVEIETKADEFIQAIDAFAFALRHEYQFFPEITVRLCAEAIHDISNISSLNLWLKSGFEAILSANNGFFSCILGG
ncbi:hypothetical protein PT286_08805 [Neisseriaceae bacterium ESL0693]|nr:hypothetical protein [Neisseriaceae bacterium ESL0693]